MTALKTKTQGLKKFQTGWQSIYHPKFIKIFLNQTLNIQTNIRGKNSPYSFQT